MEMKAARQYWSEWLLVAAPKLLKMEKFRSSQKRLPFQEICWRGMVEAAEQLRAMTGVKAQCWSSETWLQYQIEAVAHISTFEKYEGD